MENTLFDNLEIAPPEVVLQAAHDFAAALAETTQFKAFEQAVYQIKHDSEAAQAREAFLAKQTALRALIQLNAIPEKDQAELEQLRLTYLNLPCVTEYQQAEFNLRELCQVLSGMLSEQIGLDFAAASSSGCCG